MSEFTEKLEEMRETWSERSEMGFTQIPDGTYDCRLQNAELGEAQSSGDLQVHVEFLIYTGSAAGQVIHTWIRLAGEWGPSFFRRFLESLGLEFPDDPTKIEETLSELVDAAPPCRVRVSTKGDFTNVRVLRLLDEDDLPAQPEVEEGEDEDGGENEDGEEEEEEEEEEGIDVGDEISWFYRGEVKSGTVVKVLAEDRFRVKDSESGRVTVVTSDDIVDGEGEDGGEDEEEAEEETITQLREFYEANGLEFDEEASEADLVKGIKKANLDPETLMDSEKEFLESIGITFKEKPAAPKAKPKAEAKTRVKKPAAKAGKPTASGGDETKRKEALHLLKTYTEEKVNPKAPLSKLVDLLGEYTWVKKDMEAADYKAVISLLK